MQPRRLYDEMVTDVWAELLTQNGGHVPDPPLPTEHVAGFTSSLRWPGHAFAGVVGPLGAGGSSPCPRCRPAAHACLRSARCSR